MLRAMLTHASRLCEIALRAPKTQCVLSATRTPHRKLLPIFCSTNFTAGAPACSLLRAMLTHASRLCEIALRAPKTQCVLSATRTPHRKLLPIFCSTNFTAGAPACSLLRAMLTHASRLCEIALRAPHPKILCNPGR